MTSDRFSSGVNCTNADKTSRLPGRRQDFDDCTVVSALMNSPRHHNHMSKDYAQTRNDEATQITSKNLTPSRRWKNAMVKVKHRRLSGNSHAQEDARVPIPLPFLINIVQGSALVTIVPKDSSKYTINGQSVSVKSYLGRGDCIRIFSPHSSADCIVSPDQATIFDDTSFTLMSPYNHSHILRSETLEKANEELCRRLTRRTNDLPMLHESGNSADAGKIKVEGSQHSAVPDGTNFTEVRLWKLVSKKEEKRKAWRREYDDGEVGWTSDYDKSRVSKQYCFGVKIRLRELEAMCVDLPCDPSNSLHMQRVNYVTKVEASKMLGEAFRFVCQWHPVGKLIDQVKWAKFARKMRFLPGLKNSNHEVDMAFFRQSSQQAGRKLDQEGFTATIQDIARMQFPTADKEVCIGAIKHNF